MRRIARLSAASSVLLATTLLGASACGGSEQRRPEIVSTFPADGAVVPAWLDHVRVTYDEPVTVLNPNAVLLADDVNGEGIYVEAFDDPSDPFSILVKPIAGGHFFPGDLHHLVIQEGAVATRERHYKLQEFSTYFTVGAAPNLVVTSSDGRAYEIDTASGAQLSMTLPPAGFNAREPVGTAGRIWVWLDPTVPGDSELGTFVPGDAVMTVVPIAGEVGVRTGVSFAVSIDGATLYATSLDAGSNRGRVHRINVATLTEALPSIQLTPALAGSPTSFDCCLDIRRNRLYVPFSSGAGGANVAVVALSTFTELDAGPAPGVDALPVPYGAGDTAYEPFLDVFYMLIEGVSNPGFILIGPTDFAQFPVSEPTLGGTPVSLFITPPGQFVVQGLNLYPTTDGLCRSSASDIGQGFAIPVLDDVGGFLQGSNRVLAMVNDPVLTRFHAFSSDGVESWMEDYEWDTADVGQIDLDLVTPGIQAIGLATAMSGFVTGAAYPLGISPP